MKRNEAKQFESLFGPHKILPSVEPKICVACHNTFISLCHVDQFVLFPFT